LFGGVLPFLPESFADLKDLSKLFLSGAPLGMVGDKYGTAQALLTQALERCVINSVAQARDA